MLRTSFAFFCSLIALFVLLALPVAGHADTHAYGAGGFLGADNNYVTLSLNANVTKTQGMISLTTRSGHINGMISSITASPSNITLTAPVTVNGAAATLIGTLTYNGSVWMATFTVTGLAQTLSFPAAAVLGQVFVK